MNLLEKAFLDSLVTKRWFLHKNRRIKKVVVVHTFDLSEKYALWILELCLDGEENVLYSYPVVKGSASIDLMENPLHFSLFLKTLFQKKCMETDGAFLKAHIESSDFSEALFENGEGQNKEQSNSSIVFPGRCFFKWYRFLNAGVHPEIEAGLFLLKQGFRETSKILAYISYEVGGNSYAVGVVQSYLKTEWTAWDYFSKEQSLELAFLLGKQLASLHSALATMQGSFLDFENERLLSHLNLLKLELATSEKKLAGRSLKAAQELQENFPVLEERVHALLKGPSLSKVSRIHGDLHLGQILFDGQKFLFIDFEGEPVRPLPERREKRPVLIDVAGMIRSFRYASVVFGWKSSSVLEKAFLKGYGGDLSGLSRYVFQKALYEARYELKSRPDWFYIPAEDLLTNTRS